MKRYELTKEQWEQVQQIIPPQSTGKRGRPRKDNRNMLNGMLWIVHSGAQWQELPEVYGPWQSVYVRFAKWRDDGTLEAVFRALSADMDMDNLSLDSTCVKIHESANGGGKTTDQEAGFPSQRLHRSIGVSVYSRIWWQGTLGRVPFSHQQYLGLSILPKPASSWNIRRTFPLSPLRSWISVCNSFTFSFNEQSKESMNDKICRLIKNQIADSQ